MRGSIRACIWRDGMTDITERAVSYDAAEVRAPAPREVMRRRALRHKGLMIGGAWLAFVLLVAIFAPVIAPDDPYGQDLSRRLLDPVWLPGGTWEHPFGTDALGRDYLSRIIFGARISLMVGIGASLISGLIGA